MRQLIMLSRQASLVCVAVLWLGTGFAAPLGGEWISGDTAAPESPAPVLEKRFELAEIPQNSVLTLAVAGWHELSVNGKRVGDDVLSPVTCQPDRRLSSVAYDISPFLKKGGNVVDVLLGNGWYNCFTKEVWGFSSAPWLGAPKVCGELVADGKVLFVTDGSWTAYDSPIVFNALRNGEYYDARREGSRANVRAVKVEAAPSAAVSPEDVAPCRAFDPIAPVRSFPAGNGGTIYDFGSNRTGWCEIEVVGEAGAKVTIDYDECLTPTNTLLGDVGIFIRRNKDPRPAQHDEYTLAGKDGGERWQPRFTYHGFRYAQVRTEGKVMLKSIKSVFVHSDFDSVGSFKISDPVFAKLQDATRRSYLSNFTGIPTDCPHREKNGWTGDAQLAMETGLWNFDAKVGYVHFLRMLVDAQKESGALSIINPASARWGYRPAPWPAWDAALFEIPWQIYRFYGDDAPAREAYPAMKKYLSFVGGKAREDGLVKHGLGDWCAPKGVKVAPVLLTDSAYVYEFCRRVAFWAERFGESDFAAECRSKAAKVRASFNREFYKGDGIYAGGELTSLAAPLYFKGLCADGEERKVVGELLRRVRKNGHKAMFGILGAKWIPRVLADYGYIDDAWRIFTQPDAPGWAMWMKDNDTLLESFDDTAGGTPVSHNHIMFGDLSAWAFEYLAGIRIDEPGFAKFHVEPHLPDGVESFETAFRTPCGRTIRVRARREDGKVRYDVDEDGKSAGPADEALPIVGTDNTKELSNGNLYPCIARPWGAHGWSPQTGDNDTGWFYAYGDRRICGIRQTHQPSPWIGDYGQFSLMPAKELDKFDSESRASWFSHKTEFARPYVYRVYLADYDTTVEVAPSCRAAAMRATYPKTDRPQFVVDAFSGGAITRVDSAGCFVEGVSRRAKLRKNEKVDGKSLENFFRIEFDRPFASWKTDGSLALVEFAPVERGESVNLRVASSFVSPEQAKLNLAEVAGTDVDAVAAEGRAEWNALMSRVTVETDDIDRRRMFYTCLYRAMLFPRRFFDIDAAGKPIHRSPHTHEVLPGRYYCDSGFWDTFRALFPLLNFLYPEMNAEMTEGLVHCYEEGGWLPEWSSPGYRNCMIGNNSASVVADALLTGAADMKYAPKLYEALLHGANAVHPRISSEGRLGFEHYNEKGYVPRDVGIRESAARTLEYAYDDWCIWMLGRRLGRPADELALYAARSGNWRNVFDPTRSLACGRNADGSYDVDFNKYKWGGDFTEGNALHYTWSVFHDIAALIDAMGGREKFNATLDSIFELPPVFDESYYKTVIHEIREMQIMGFGQYAHGNQPIQHMPYLYDWSGEPWKTQKRVGEIVERLYRPTSDGYCGDEDNGQTSAWYVWSCLGFYPVCPGSGEYALGAPQVTRARLAFGERSLEIRAVLKDGSPVTDFSGTPYIAQLTLDGIVLDRNYVTREELAKGGDLVFTMSAEPNKSRGTSAAAAPYSYSTGGNAL